MTTGLPTASIAARSLLGLTRADRIVPKATKWLIKHHVAQDTLVGLVAASGTGKSFLAIDWACCVATGTPWNGYEVSAGPVCYLAGEGAQGLRKRISAWEKHYGISVKGAPLFISTGLPELCEGAAAIQSIEEMIAETISGPSFVVIDTVARAMGGANENSAEDIGALIRAMDWIREHCGATVLSVHHTGNNPSDQSRARGSSAYRAALDTEFLMKKKGDGTVELHTSKAKDSEGPESLIFRKVVVPLTIGSESETSLVLTPVSSCAGAVDRLADALELHAEGMSYRQIGERLGVSKSSIDRWLRHANPVPSRPILRNGDGGTVVPRDKWGETSRDTRDTSVDRAQGMPHETEMLGKRGARALTSAQADMRSTS